MNLVFVSLLFRSYCWFDDKSYVKKAVYIIVFEDLLYRIFASFYIMLV